ncbi:MAG: Gfo/Idh/MocA family oxidoreductase [Chitinophagaceae bacterium]|nr:Gfo/Idh/MocA family oxidoreductase [Chitinophagaceae bacterium]
MKKINWGIIGCGDVTEVKSGPAFNKVADSALVAVMRRDAAKAKDYALRHHVPCWYNDANQLINDAAVNAVYIATPPSSHYEYALAAMEAGKPIYVEKPMALNYMQASSMAAFSTNNNIKMVVAHYRREQPFFKKIKELLNDKIIGDILSVNLVFNKTALTPAELTESKTAWRIEPAISGGGLFHDLAPHQLDLMYYFFGEVEQANGVAINQAGLYHAHDLVAGHILFKNKVVFTGNWCFNASPGGEKDHCEMIGSKGKIEFNVFGKYELILTSNDGMKVISFDKLEHVQQPMIEATVNYFLDKRENPCSGEDGAVVMWMMDAMTSK